MARAREVKLDCDEPFARAAALVVGVRAVEVLEHARGVLDAGDPERVHDMRVATRRLRAAMEVVGPCFGPEAKAARRAARELQGVLGEIHDCDVMLPRAEGIDSLAALLRSRRELLFRRFHDLWQAEIRKGTWAALERAL